MKAIGKILPMFFLFSLIFSVMCCNDAVNYEPPRGSEVSPGTFEAPRGMCYEICENSNSCYYTSTIHVVDNLDGTKTISFDMPDHSVGRIKHIVIHDPISVTLMNAQNRDLH